MNRPLNFNIRWSWNRSSSEINSPNCRSSSRWNSNKVKLILGLASCYVCTGWGAVFVGQRPPPSPLTPLLEKSTLRWIGNCRTGRKMRSSCLLETFWAVFRGNTRCCDDGFPVLCIRNGDDSILCSYFGPPEELHSCSLLFQFPCLFFFCSCRAHSRLGRSSKRLVVGSTILKL